MKKQLMIGMLVIGLASPAHARWGSGVPAHPGWVSDWSFHCSVKQGNVQAVTFDVWDDSFEHRNLWRPHPTRLPPTWTVTATPAELAEMNLRIQSERVLGLGRTCQVTSQKTGEKLSFEEAWIVFGDIQHKRQASTEEREAVRRNAIRARLGITQEAVTRGE